MLLLLDKSKLESTGRLGKAAPGSPNTQGEDVPWFCCHTPCTLKACAGCASRPLIWASMSAVGEAGRTKGPAPRRAFSAAPWLACLGMAPTPPIRVGCCMAALYFLKGSIFHDQPYMSKLKWHDQRGMGLRVNSEPQSLSDYSSRIPVINPVPHLFINLLWLSVTN